MRGYRRRIDRRIRPVSRGRLREEIEALERRLQQMDPDSDCGYEKALIRFLEHQPGLRRVMLQVAAE